MVYRPPIYVALATGKPTDYRGPPDGRPVLFVHGISTPSLALYPLAQNLVTTQSCRVLLIDLWGRGYSDAPTDLPYDARLYTTQILLALTSSPISWTGTDTPFDVIGYSLGGGIAANFAAHFPSLVRSLILLTPAGLIRRHRRSWAMRFLYSSSLLPEGLLGWFVKRSLNTAGGARNAHESQNSRAALPILSAASQELPKGGDDAALEEPLIATYPHVNIASAVSWQVARHAGFAHAFIASIRSSPSVEQGEVWARIPSDAGKQPKVLILAGEKDPLILADELSEDARRVLGEENCVIKILDCGHELPVTRAEDVGRCIVRFWNSGC